MIKTFINFVYNCSMVWTDDKDKMLLREILTVDPFTGTKKGTIQRGKKWSVIADNLCSSKDENFKVDQRAVRDRYNLLSQRFKKKMRDEEKASGISVPDLTEMEIALEDIIEKEESAEDHSVSRRKRDEEDKVNGEKIRMKAMQSLSQKRKQENNDNEVKKRRRSGPQESLKFLQEKKELQENRRKEEMELRREELELKKKQFELESKRQENMMALFQQQQQQMMAIIAKLSQN